MKYGVKILNTLKNRYAVALFDKPGCAEMCFKKMKKLESTTGLSDYERAVEYEKALKNAIAYEEDLPKKYVDNVIIHNFTYYINDKGRVQQCLSNIRFVFKKEYVTVPS